MRRRFFFHARLAARSVGALTACLSLLIPISTAHAITKQECEKLNGGFCGLSGKIFDKEYKEIAKCTDMGGGVVAGAQGVFTWITGAQYNCYSKEKLPEGGGAKTEAYPTGVVPPSEPLKEGAISGVSTPPITLTDPLRGIGLIGALNRVIMTFLGMVGAFALLVFVYSGIVFMTAGSSDRVKKAMDAMKYAILGLIIIMFAYIITNVYFNVLTQEAPGEKATPPPVTLPQPAP